MMDGVDGWVRMDGSTICLLVKVTKIVFRNVNRNVLQTRSVVQYLMNTQKPAIIVTAYFTKAGHTHLEVLEPTQNVLYFTTQNEVRILHCT